MKGIQIVVDEAGKKTGVLIDLKRWGDLWEDFYDVAISELRSTEKTVSWETLKKELSDKK